MENLVIFDCDGTLVDSEEVASRVFRSYWESHGVYVSESEFKENVVGKGYEHPYMLELYKKLPDDAVSTGDQLWRDALKDTLEPVSGIKQIVSSIKSRLAVGSNSSLDHVVSALKTTRLDTHFGENVFSAHQLPNPKPSPDLFLHILNTLRIGKTNSVVVEDSESGIQAAQNAGIKVIAFTGASHFTESTTKKIRNLKPDWHCSSSIELSDLLTKLGHC